MSDFPHNLQSWLSDPLAAFVTHIQSEQFKKTARRQRHADFLSPASVTVYTSWFRQFVAYLQDNKLTLQSVEAAHIHAFLTQKKDGSLVLNSGIQYRYARLLERVFLHLQRVPNPMADILFGPMQEHYKLEGRNQETVALSPAQIAAFMEALPVSDAQSRSNRRDAGWKKQRDRALQCMLLGAGLKVAEVVALQVHELDPTRDIDGTLRVHLQRTGTPDIDAKHPTFYPHTTFLQAPFVDEVLRWTARRAALGLPGALLFPNQDGAMLNRSSVYRQVSQTFNRASLPVPRMGGRTLRNTFAVQELAEGTGVDALIEKLGLFEDRSVDTYTHVAKAPKS